MGRTRRYNRYSPEFKRETLKRASEKRASEDGSTGRQVCEELGISVRHARTYSWTMVQS